MIQQLLTLLPSAPLNLKLFVEIAAALSLIGLGLWLAGARFSRQIVALAGVAVGAIAGKYLPQFVPRAAVMDPSALAIMGALLCGVLAFLTHRFWIGLSFGTVLSWWAALGTWATMHGQQPWSPPPWDADMDYIGYAQTFWSGLPPDVTRILPYAAGCAMLSGIALAILWPRIATALNWSLAGLSLALCAGLAAVSFTRPEWLGMLPTQTWSQITSFIGLVIFGALVQWKLAPRGAVRPVKKPTEETA